MSTPQVTPRGFRSPWLAALFFLISAPAVAQVFRSGDVVFASRVASNIGSTTGQVEWYSDDGLFHQTIAAYANDPVLALVFGSDARLYATRPHLSPQIIVFGTAGEPLGAFGPVLPIPQAITRDRAGNLFVGATLLHKIDTTGNLLATYTAPGGMLDLAVDQCTMFIAEAMANVIRRFDVCQNVPMSDFTTSLPGSIAWDLRLLSDGSLLVANEQSVVRLTSAGAVSQTYLVPGANGWRAIALAPDELSFWAAAANEGVYRIRLSDGAVIQGPLPGAWITSIAVVGEPRAALGADADVPVFSIYVLAGFTLVLVVVATRRI
jgi:hypothetical protein